MYKIRKGLVYENKLDDVKYIRVDRVSALGNKFIMKDKSNEERERVCNEYEIWFNEKVKLKDEKVMKELRYIWKMLKKSNVVLCCWCGSKRCHSETIIKFIESYM